jgi:uncharacterized LabA/DUF88 family protein
MDRRIAVFIDFENIARSVRERNPDERVDLRAILRALIETPGGDTLAVAPGAPRAVLKRAYGDWRQFGDYRSDLLQNGVEPVQVFASRSKNGSDIRIAIDAMEVACKMPEITDVALITGDSDFLSLVNRLRENGKLVTGMGVERNTSLYLVQSCDRFIFYDDIVEAKALEEDPTTDDPRGLVLEAVRRLSSRQGQPGLPPPGTPLKAAVVKGLMRRLNPSWSEELLGFATFQEFLQSQSDAVLVGRPANAPDLFVAERGTVAEERLARALEGEWTELAPAPLAEEVPIETALTTALRWPHPDEPQTAPVKGAVLKARLRALRPSFREADYGCGTFLEFLFSHPQLVCVFRPGRVGDVLVAEVASPAAQSSAARLAGQQEALPGTATSGSISEAASLYLRLLRRRRIRHVPAGERRRIVEVLYHALDEMTAGGEILSLKEAKDRAHQWFEQNEPSVSWDTINNVVYHLFWTFCFSFSPASENLPLWDRPVRWSEGIQSPADALRRCDRGLIHMIWQELPGHVRLDPIALSEVLGDGDETTRAYFEELVAGLSAAGRPGADREAMVGGAAID